MNIHSSAWDPGQAPFIPLAHFLLPLHSSMCHPLTPGVRIRSKLSAPVDTDQCFVQTPTELWFSLSTQCISREDGETASAPCSKYRHFPNLCLSQSASDLRSEFEGFCLFVCLFLRWSFLHSTHQLLNMMSTEQWPHAKYRFVIGGSTVEDHALSLW